MEQNTKGNIVIYTVKLSNVLFSTRKFINKFLAATILTLRGSSYLSYRVYDWKDRVHSSLTRFSMVFKTRFDDSVLLYTAGGEHGIDHYVAASIFNNSIYVEMNFGEEAITTILGHNKDFKLFQWNNLTIFHRYEQVDVILNDEKVTVNISGIPGCILTLKFILVVGQNCKRRMVCGRGIILSAL